MNRRKRRRHAVTVQRHCEHEFVWNRETEFGFCEKCQTPFVLTDKWAGRLLRLPDGGYLA